MPMERGEEAGCSVNQRWLLRRGSFVHDNEIIDPKEYEVVALYRHAEARAFVEQHHYSGSCPSVIRCFALLHGRVFQRLVGVALFSRPVADSVLTTWFPGSANESLELGRFVLLDSVLSNAETWFLSRCFRMLRRDLRGVVSFSDPHPRRTAAGELVFVGHFGRIYQASNAIYAGLATPRTVHLFDDATIFNERAQSKVRKGPGYKGFDYASALLTARGAVPLCEGESPATWLQAWRSRLTRAARHTGNHRYLFPFHRQDRERLRSLAPYPKQIGAVL